MVALDSTGGSIAPSTAGGGSDSAPEVQQIWIYFEEREEAENLARLCKGCRRPKLVPRVVDPPRKPPWRKFLQEQLSSIRPPSPYRPDGWEDFWGDVDALLTASLASSSMAKARLQRVASSSDTKDNFKHLQAMRWPSLLVTDREALCKAMSDVSLQASLAEAIQRKASDLLPVLRSSDFGLLTGILVVETPLPRSPSMVLKAVPLPDGMAEEAPPCCRPFSLRHGLYRQKPKPRSGDAVAGNELFGARCLALTASGRCAYSAVSTDGVQTVDATGPFEIINGHVVIGGRSGEAIVQHWRFSSGRRHLLSAVTYEEPIHISLEDLDPQFEVAVDPAHCATEASEHFKLLLRAEGALEMLVEDVDMHGPPTARGGHLAVPASLPGGPSMICYVQQALGAAGRRAPPPLPTDTANQLFTRTPLHALLALAGGAVSEEIERPDLRPRLLGNDRGLTQGPKGLPKLCGSSHVDSPGASRNPSLGRSRTSSVSGSTQPPGNQVRCEVSPSLAGAALKRLTNRDSTPQAQEKNTCPLRPGVYTYSFGQRGNDDYKSVSMRLSATGECRYSEISGNDSLRALSGVVCWSVRESTLIIAPKEAGVYGFMQREAKGHKRVERSVGQLEIPVSAVLARCVYMPFHQQLDPFPGHVPLDPEFLVFGLVDPASPVLRALRCRPDRIPYHAFEHELRQHGLPCDDLISDFRYLDCNSDGQISVADIRRLESYGSPVAAPEIIHELREALVACCGTLADAFEALKSFAGGSARSRVSFTEFQQFVLDQAAKADQPTGPTALRGPHEKQLMKQWVSKTTVEDRAAVFSSMNPSNRPDIDMSDFLCLSIHTALLAVHRLQHFQSWVFEYFGTTKKAFAEVFVALDKYKAEVLTRKVFADGPERLGYPCDRAAALSMFSLLDKNFDGEVTLKDFQKLADFNAETVLRNLIAFASFTKANLGGFDEFFKKLLQRERAVQGINGVDRKAVSYTTFQKVCSLVGFSKVLPDIDLRMLFLFLDEASGKHADGFLDANEWSLLKGLTSRALTGSPARLRRVLLAEYGSMDQAFEAIHTSWLQRALPRGLRRMAIAELAQAQSEAGGSDAAGSNTTPHSLQAEVGQSVSRQVSGLGPLRVGRPAKVCERAHSSPCSLSTAGVPNGLPPRP
eukprot:CAMPEP_0178446022 /NCGR_PEP_ID=MMETSP0689_2-20121128/40542_1 /TAXON_ID=160604 /ORGANISM="Amphidinium massartii, Strain CS-259" /LENGTH=1146 /DNA_ID=CAMNT_0020070739 /DNA_START=91 /DNA_END=3529 /DNA_ORIENTATION=-